MRTKNVAKTFLYGIILTSIIAVLGIFKTKILLSYLGIEYVGIYQLFFQIYMYLSLVDGGLGATVAYQLYKPISENDNRKINEIIAGAKSYFNKIGIIVIILGIILSLGIMFFIKQTTISPWYIRLCFVLYIVSSACSYFTITHAILYDAEQKLYKSSNLNHILSICESIISIIIAMIGGKLLTIIICFLILNIFKNIILMYISKRDHQYLRKCKKMDMTFKKEANNLFVVKINNLIFNNIDIIIVSKFLGLGSVFIYTIYNQIISMLTQMVQRLNSALTSSIGNLLAIDAGNSKAVYNEINSLLFYIGSIISVPLLYMISPFIQIWYGQNYVCSNVVCLFFVIILYINIIKISLDTYLNASGEFKSIRNSAIYQSIINVTLSLVLVNKYGIQGILFATILSFIISNFIYYPKIIANKIIDDKVNNYYKKFFKYIIGLIINIVICYYFNKLLNNSNIFIWFVNGVMIFIINFVLTTVYYILSRELLFLNRLKLMIQNFKMTVKNREVD